MGKYFMGSTKFLVLLLSFYLNCESLVVQILYLKRFALCLCNVFVHYVLDNPVTTECGDVNASCNRSVKFAPQSDYVERDVDICLHLSGYIEEFICRNRYNSVEVFRKIVLILVTVLYRFYH